MRTIMRPLVAEFIGTFFLVFAGVGAIVSDAYRTGSVGLVGIAAAHGVALAIGVTATMNISGGHLNPAITIGLFSVGRIDLRKAIEYVVAQLLGATVAVFAIKSFYPEMAGTVTTYGAPTVARDISAAQGLLVEAILTFLLATAVMGTAVDPAAPKVGGFAIGLTVFFGVLAGGQITGAAMNPARAFGPELVGWSWTGWGIYWLGPVLGSVAAMQLYERLLMREG